MLRSTQLHSVVNSSFDRVLSDVIVQGKRSFLRRAVAIEVALGSCVSNLTSPRTEGWVLVPGASIGQNTNNANY